MSSIYSYTYRVADPMDVKPADESAAHASEDDLDTGHNDDGLEGKIGDKERDANARLIAAAPELLEWLEELHALFQYKYETPSEKWILEQSLLTIKKARGQ